jgi:hypothetical protein
MARGASARGGVREACARDETQERKPVSLPLLPCSRSNRRTSRCWLIPGTRPGLECPSKERARDSSPPIKSLIRLQRLDLRDGPPRREPRNGRIGRARFRARTASSCVRRRPRGSVSATKRRRRSRISSQLGFSSFISAFLAYSSRFRGVFARLGEKSFAGDRLLSTPPNRSRLEATPRGLRPVFAICSPVRHRINRR